MKCSLTLFLALVLVSTCAGADADRLRNMLVVNEDNSHFFGSRKPEQMTLKELHAWVDQYAGGAVTHLFLCPNSMRASFRSRSRDAIWDPVKGKVPQGLWPENAKRLHDAGLDPYAIWIARARQKRLSPWLTMRMNDVHNANETDHYYHSTFWREHPQFWRVPGSPGGSWVERAMNYAHAEVREHQMAFVRELLERYDPDGLELDWMRFGYHLTAGRESQEGRVLTEFVRDVRVLTTEWSTKRKHPIRLGVRVPAHPDAAAGLGMDAVKWAREGLVDLVVACPFWTSSDFDIPIELWHKRLGAATNRVAVLPGLEHNSRPWPSAAPTANDRATLHGFAASAYHRGADSIYLFNWMDSETRPCTVEEYRTLLQRGLSAQTVSTAVRRHPVCYRDTVPPGFANGVQLPVDLPTTKPIKVHLGPAPQKGKVQVVVGLAKRDGVGDVRLQATLNGRTLAPGQDVGTTGFAGSPARGVRFACPLDAVKSGYNEVEVRAAGGDASQQLVWVELRVESK